MRNKKPSFRKGRKPTQDQLKNILDLHWKWAFSEEGGQRADLERVNLSHCNLQNAFLGGACLRHAKLRGIDLRRADLGGADLYGAQLQFADLRDADLSYADLRCANLQYAKLDRTVLQHVTLNDMTATSEKVVQIISLGYTGAPSDIRYFVEKNLIQYGCGYEPEKSLDAFVSQIDKCYPAVSAENRLVRRQYYALIDYFREVKRIWEEHLCET